MWRNKAISDTQEPGSTFKIITATAALEENIVDMEDKVFNCQGSMKIGTWNIKCLETLLTTWYRISKRGNIKFL